MTLDGSHPIPQWFRAAFGAPTRGEAKAWPVMASSCSLATASSPLNRVGIISAGERVPALPSNRMVYRDGVPIAVRLGKAVQSQEATQQQGAWEVKDALIQRRIPPELRATLGPSG